MMAPAATAAASGAKAGAFDLATIVVADKAAATEAQVNLAAAVKKEGVEFLGQIGFTDAIVKVSGGRFYASVVCNGASVAIQAADN